MAPNLNTNIYKTFQTGTFCKNMAKTIILSKYMKNHDHENRNTYSLAETEFNFYYMPEVATWESFKISFCGNLGKYGLDLTWT